MCYPCTRCNKCGKYPPPGTCYKCGHLNPLGVPVCENCGNPFPPPPGVQVKAKVASEDSEQPDELDQSEQPEQPEQPE